MSVTDYWTKLAVARHEACHAVVALKLGLPVAWVTVTPGRDEGVDFGAAVKIPDEGIDLTNPEHVQAVAMSMAAPSYLHTGDVMLDAYARVEAATAWAIADQVGLDSEVLDLQLDTLVDDHKEEILLLAERLLKEGTVHFEPSPEVQEAGR